MWVCFKIRKAFLDTHTTPCGIVIITDSFDVLNLKKALNKAVLQTANLSKVVKRRRRKKGMSGGEEGKEARRRERERGEGWRAVVDEDISEDQTRLVEKRRERRAQMGKVNERKSDKNSCF